GPRCCDRDCGWQHCVCQCSGRSAGASRRGAPARRAPQRPGAVQPLEAQALHGLVYAATHGGAGGMLRVTRRTQPPLAVLVAPLPTRLRPATALAPALALVLITDTADGPGLAEQALQQLFALTTAEAGVALALAAGRSAEEIALERGVSMPTVR